MARKRELIDTGTDKRYVRRNKLGTSFVESDDVGRSLAADRGKRAKTKVKSRQGDKGDRARPKTKRKAASKGSKKTAGRKGAVCPQERREAPLARFPTSSLSPLACWSIVRRTARIGCMRSSWTAGAFRSA
jgi:hypothetical protein